MLYTTAIDQLENRIRWHCKEGGLLAGLKLMKSAEYRIESTDDLPNIVLTDLTFSEQDSRGKSESQVSFLLKTARADGIVEAVRWLERVMDALEQTPEAVPAPDLLLRAYNPDGTPLMGQNNRQVELLNEAFSSRGAMAEITDMTFLWQVDIDLALSISRGKRLTYPA
jgi:hypothetical protein